MVVEFQSTHPARGATGEGDFIACFHPLFQSTHPARGATAGDKLGGGDQRISIHAPREGCDHTHIHIIGVGQRISIHAPREGCDDVSKERFFVKAPFQSTHPARGATAHITIYWYETRNFNPRTPRGVRPLPPTPLSRGKSISIHAPREGCDAVFFVALSTIIPFQSTHPARGATMGYTLDDLDKKISIHAPREGCDDAPGHYLVCTNVFQSTHPARGATCRPQSLPDTLWSFQSTHPARGATPTTVQSGLYQSISIHAPREGCDLVTEERFCHVGIISIHAPREGCDTDILV